MLNRLAKHNSDFKEIKIPKKSLKKCLKQR